MALVFLVPRMFDAVGARIRKMTRGATHVYPSMKLETSEPIPEENRSEEAPSTSPKSRPPMESQGMNFSRLSEASW